MDNIYLVLIAILIVAITFILSTRQFKKKKNVVIFLGLSDSGKTAIFSKLVFNKSKNSVKSLKENEANLRDLDLRLIDLPGSERLRPRYWDQYRSLAKQLVFVVDSTTLDKSLRDCAEYLYSILSDPIMKSNKPQFILACNKQDLDGAKPRTQIKSLLEDELTAIKETKQGQLGRTSEIENEDRLRDLFDERISLDLLKVQIIETSVNNLDQLIKIIL